MINLPQRPQTWQKIIDQDNETCHWLSPDGNQHSGTIDENAEVRRQLLEIRVRGEKCTTQKSKERM